MSLFLLLLTVNFLLKAVFGLKREFLLLCYFPAQILKDLYIFLEHKISEVFINRNIWERPASIDHF